jgi:hypothetical protein
MVGGRELTMKITFVKAEKKDSHDTIITLHQEPSNIIESIIGVSTGEISAYGGSTVWYWWPSCDRCETMWEVEFAKWNRMYENGLLNESTRKRHI